MMRWSTASSAFVLAVAFALPSAAQTGPEGQAGVAEGLFERGRRLMEQGSYEQACPLLEESYRLDPAGGTGLNLAVCHERAGKLATAYAHFQEALRTAKRDGRDDRSKIAQQQLDALRPRVSTLEIRTSGASPANLVVELDEQALPSAAFGVPTPIDGGRHKVTAIAPGYRSFERVVTVKTERDAVVVEIPALVAVGSSPTPGPAQVGVGLKPAATQGDGCIVGFRWDGFGCSPVPTETRVSSELWGWVGVTGAFLSVGSIAGVVAINENGEATEHIRRQDYDEADSADDRAIGWAWASTGAFAFAGLFALVGLGNAFEQVPIEPETRAHLFVDGQRVGVGGAF